MKKIIHSISEIQDGDIPDSLGNIIAKVDGKFKNREDHSSGEIDFPHNHSTQNTK